MAILDVNKENARRGGESLQGLGLHCDVSHEVPLTTGQCYDISGGRATY